MVASSMVSTVVPRKTVKGGKALVMGVIADGLNVPKKYAVVVAVVVKTRHIVVRFVVGIVPI